ncbi:MAG: SDR family NAD(P)-dependent oxidoreductase [Enterocloster sp.]|uniref:SDR family NAD(P)-dependent oxidoreductase n=1 Tax=Enterocloster sp. TaxID=2719315 RepID=UPI0039939DA7
MIQYEKVNGNFDLTGKAAIVVGGAGGIGEATAQMYARKGARVAIVDCKDNCPEVAAKIAEEFGVQVIGVKCDVTSQESVDAMMKAVLEAFGEINISLPCLDSWISTAHRISPLLLLRNICLSMRLECSGYARRLLIR